MRSEILWITGGRVLTALIGLASLRVMTHLLDPGTYATLALLVAFQGFAGLVLLNPVGQYFNRHLHQWYDDGTLPERFRALSLYWGVSALVAGAASAIWFAFTPEKSLAYHPVVYGISVALAVYAVTWHGAATSRLNMLGERRSSVTWQLAGVVARLGASWVLATWEPTAIYWLVGQALGSFVCAFGADKALMAIARRAANNSASTGLREMFFQRAFAKFGIPLALITALTWVENDGYRLILGGTSDFEMLGLFFLALGIPASLTAHLQQIVQQILYPHFFRGLVSAATPEQKQQLVSNMINTLLPVYLLYGAFLVVTGRHFLYLLADTKYHAAAGWIIYGVLIEIVRLVGGLWILSAQANKDFRPAIAPFLVGAALVLGAACTSAWALLSLQLFAWVFVGAFSAQYALLVLFMKRALYVAMDWKRTGSAFTVFVAAIVTSTFPATPFGVVGNLFFLTTVFLMMVVPAGWHLRTSAALRDLLSHRLRQG